MNFLPDTSSRLIFAMLIVWGYFLFFKNIHAGIASVWYWLKGSRKVYGLFNGKLFETTTNASLLFGESFIEIIERPFYKKARIFGKNSARWTVSDGRQNPLVAGEYELTLYDKGRQSIETVLGLVTTAPSLPSLLNRIAELEKDVDLANNSRRSLRAAIRALINRMELDRQHYRSKAAADARACLEYVDRRATQIGEPQPERSTIEMWSSLWPKREHDHDRLFTDQLV